MFWPDGFQKEGVNNQKIFTVNSIQGRRKPKTVETNDGKNWSTISSMEVR